MGYVHCDSIQRKKGNLKKCGDVSMGKEAGVMATRKIKKFFRIVNAQYELIF